MALAPSRFEVAGRRAETREIGFIVAMGRFPLYQEQ